MKRPSPSWRSERLFQSQQPLFPLPQLGGGYCGHQHPLALPQPAAGDPGARLRRPLPNLRPLCPPGGKRRLFPVPPLLFGEPAAGLPPFPGGSAPGASAPFGTKRDGGCRRGGGGVRHRPLRRLHGGPLPSLWGGLLAPSPFGAV